MGRGCLDFRDGTWHRNYGGGIATLAVGARTFAKRFATERQGYGALALRAVEVGAAALVLMFGMLLLTGYMVSERLFGV